MWIVILREINQAAWGPFATEDDARRFGEWVWANIDPCWVMKLSDPTAEMVRDWRYRTGRAVVSGGAE